MWLVSSALNEESGFRRVKKRAQFPSCEVAEPGRDTDPGLSVLGQEPLVAVL